ncbi:cysteine-tryptophan domain-containing zinc finger protein 7-like isoform X2 [Diospyros lotus]|nr:cysteine-tryptophan domain-containing zinc finger protein 7-like isoform X2 [Diospyros lotus]
MVDMEDTELEEGEACYYKDDTSIDPDIAFSYIDKKVQSVLGHFQKDFEGGVSAENLGAKFGGYGSFLPTYQRSPPVWSQPKTSQNVQGSSSPRSLNVASVEGTQNSTVLSDAARSLRSGTGSHSLQSLHTAKFPLGDVSAKQYSCLPAPQVIESYPPKHESVSNKLVNSTDQRTLKVRIKVGSDIARKNAAIYSGLGLISPSSSTGNSPEESGEMPSDCKETPNESPGHILEIMASFPVPGNLLLSPLHESLLYLSSKVKHLQSNKFMPLIKCDQEHSAALADDSTFLNGGSKVTKEKKKKAVEKNENWVALKREIDKNSDANRTTPVKQEVIIEARNMENEAQDRKSCFSYDIKVNSLSGSLCNAVNGVNGVVAPGVLTEADRNISVKKSQVTKNGMEDRLSTGLGKAESLESISDQEGSKEEKMEARSSLAEKVCVSRLGNSHRNVSADQGEVGQRISNKVSAPYKAEIHVSKCIKHPDIGTMDHSSQKVGQTSTYLEQDDLKMPHGLGKPSFKGRTKSKGGKRNGKPASETEESLMAGAHEVPKEKKKASKMQKSKSQSDVQKVHDKHKGIVSETKVEQVKNQIGSLDRPLGDRVKDSRFLAVEKEQRTSLDKSKEMSARRKIDPKLASETLFKDTANDDFPSAKGVSSEIEPTPVAPMLIEENWVCCDRCQKWRLLPYGTKPEQLPEKWLCSMLSWLPGMNSCDVSEEETEKALRALYQPPLPESQNQNNLQNHVGTAVGAFSADARHFEQIHLNLSSDGIPNPPKKNLGSKGLSYVAGNGGSVQISRSNKSLRQEVVKKRSLNSMNQPTVGSNLTSNSSVHHLGKFRDSPMERNTHEQKEKHVHSGDVKQKKLKSRREAGQHEYETVKKIKADVGFDTDDYWVTEQNLNIDRIGRGSRDCFRTKAADKRTEKQEHNPKGGKSDQKGKVQILKKRGERASVSPHTVSLNAKPYDERSLTLKKRKLKDHQENQNFFEISRDNGNHLSGSMVFIKDSSGSELRKAKKPKVSRTEGKESSASKGEDGLNKKNKMTRILLSGTRENTIHAREEVRTAGKNREPRKLKTEVASKPASDDRDSLKRDLGSEQFSRPATSSSSKVSDSRKSRGNFQEVKGSPVESVSSSPMRTSNLEKLSPARRDALEKDAVRNHDFPVMDSPRKSFDGEGNGKSNMCQTVKRGNGSAVSHSESLGFPVLDFRDNNASQKFGTRSKSSLLVNSDVDNLQSSFPGNLHASDHHENMDRANKNYYHDSPMSSGKSRKGSSLLSKEKDRISGKFERVKVKLSDLGSEKELNPNQSLRDETESGPCRIASFHEESSDLKFRLKPIKDDKSISSRDFVKWESDGGREDQVKFKNDVSAVKMGAAKKTHPTQVELRSEYSQVFPCHVGKQDSSANAPHSVPGSQKGSGFDVIPVDSSSKGDSSKLLKQPTTLVNHLGHPVRNQRVFKDAQSPLRRDACSHVASNVLKEAEELRDWADRLKESGFGIECCEAYFQAALKFLHGASLLETCSGDNSKHGEMSQVQIYSTTAKLCEMCAHEYEKRHEMAAAALAYKCMEVTYMRVVFCKSSSTNRDRHDLQASLLMIPQGESPSSSASDVDNLNNQAMADKVALSKGTGSHNRPNFVRLLDFTKDVSSAMEASRKSHNAFTAANVILEEAQNKEAIICVKRVIDFSFQDVDELVRLVRLAIEAINRQAGSYFGMQNDPDMRYGTQICQILQFLVIPVNLCFFGLIPWISLMWDR